MTALVVELVTADERLAIRALHRSPRYLPPPRASDDRIPVLNPSPELRALVRVAGALARKGIIKFGTVLADGTRRISLSARGEELAREIGDEEQ